MYVHGSYNRRTDIAAEIKFHSSQLRNAAFHHKSRIHRLLARAETYERKALENILT